nr:putative reverse transcriptase domain-containing protein [Tanacetum cinerariifolium]
MVVDVEMEMEDVEMVEMIWNEEWKQQQWKWRPRGNTSRAGIAARECTYKELLNCQPFNLRGPKDRGEKNKDSNIVTGTFLLNNHYASVLFDSGTDKSFMSTTFSSLMDVVPTTLDVNYVIELADGRFVESDTILRGCTLNLLNDPFNIDLMPVELGSFDIIIGMDWLLKYHALIVCDEKVVRIPCGNEVFPFHGDGNNGVSNSSLSISSCTKTQKYIQRGCHVFLAQVTKKKNENRSKKKQLEDVTIVRDFPEVFPEDLSGLPPTRQVKFQINLVLSTALVACSLYRLASSEMQELSTQLQELSDKGFIRHKTLKEEKDVVDGKLARLLKSSKDLENIIESQRSNKVKEGVGYNAVSPPAANLYRSPKKDLSWTGLPEFADDTVTDYSRPSPTIESTSAEGQNKHSTTAENGESTDSILSKPAVKFIKAGDRPAERPTTNKDEFVKAVERPTIDKVETVKKPVVRYVEIYRRTSKRRRVQRETTRSQNHAYMSPSHRSYGAPMRPSHRPAGHRPHGPPMRPQYRAPWV